MKKVAIFYRDRENQNAIMYIQNNLYSVLGEYIHIDNYYLTEMPESSVIEADAYLVLYEEMLQYLTPHINDFSRVVVISRSIRKKHIEPILEIPKGSKVLVVNDSKESILQTIYMIYELGIGHLSLVPFNTAFQEKGGYNDIYTAIVAKGSESLVPAHIKKIYNIRNREISFETFHKLIAILGLDTPAVQKNLLHKTEDDMDTSTVFQEKYLSSFFKEQLLNDIMEDYSQAIILWDNQGKIRYINEKANEIFHKTSGDIFDKSSFVFTGDLFGSADFKERLISLGTENYMANKKSILLLDEVIGYYLVLKSEKDLRDTESNLRRQIKKRGLYAKYNFEDMIQESVPMKKCIELAKKAALSDHTILVRGESGTGKELLAQSIHNYSLRKDSPFVAVNCAALPESLLESELFGYEPGAFTGAQKNGKIGLFEQADHGTIFLDEIGDISPALQSRLLRVIQERQVMRIGSDKIININVRIIAATNANLEKQMIEGKFRMDLFYRLNVISLNIAPLRERKEDILPLLKKHLGKSFNNISREGKKALLNYNWPGNIRELENLASYYSILGEVPDYIYSSDIQLLAKGAAIQAPVLAKPASYHTENELKLLILRIISDSTEALHGIGRSAIHQKLLCQNINIGEGKLKKILSEFHDNGLIEVSLGRSGSRITEKGKQYLMHS